MHHFKSILVPQRTVCGVAGSSKKRIFEIIAELVCGDQPLLKYNDVLDKLIARESLGSTGLGQGIAIPHCRVDNCPQPLGSLLTLKEPIEYDAPDGGPVDIIFVLLVPEEAQQAHLDILAEIARNFSQDDFCQQLREAQDNTALFNAATEYSG